MAPLFDLLKSSPTCSVFCAPTLFLRSDELQPLDALEELAVGAEGGGSVYRQTQLRCQLRPGRYRSVLTS